MRATTVFHCVFPSIKGVLIVYGSQHPVPQGEKGREHRVAHIPLPTSEAQRNLEQFQPPSPCTLTLNNPPAAPAAASSADLIPELDLLPGPPAEGREGVPPAAEGTLKLLGHFLQVARPEPAGAALL